MLASHLLLVIFTLQWLFNQYDHQKDSLKLNLTKLFTDVQHEVSDSLILTSITDPATGSPVTLAGISGGEASLSPQGLHRILNNANKMTVSQERKMFKVDTVVFNELFSKQMRQNGWNFRADWVNNSDSEKDGRNIFIASNFFTHENGVVIRNYDWYLFTGMLPQILFAVVLLTLTAAAFFIAFRSLKAQIKLGQLKDDFINNMSHELKTPIATVKVALEALNNYNAIDDKELSREYIGMMASEMNRLELMATRVLNTAQLEAGKIQLHKERTDLLALATEVVQNMQPRLAHHHASVQLEVTGTNFDVDADKLHLQGVLINLIDNSLKYATSAAHMVISLVEHNGAVQLSLADNGPGIPEEYRDRIFEKFFRVPTGNLHQTRGYGLGLSYAAQIMKQHNGSINVNNLAAGGCVFTLTF